MHVPLNEEDPCVKCQNLCFMHASAPIKTDTKFKLIYGLTRTLKQQLVIKFMRAWRRCLQIGFTLINTKHVFFLFFFLIYIFGFLTDQH